MKWYGNDSNSDNKHGNTLSGLLVVLAALSIVTCGKVQKPDDQIMVPAPEMTGQAEELAGEDEQFKEEGEGDSETGQEQAALETEVQMDFFEDEEEEDEEDEEDEEYYEDEEEYDEEYLLGQELFDAYCARCHGFNGDGKGSASNFTNPKPRDFTMGMYKFRSTPSGEPPTDDDMIRVIQMGVPGTSMFGWEGKFTGEELEALLVYIKEFSWETFEFEGEPIEIGEPPPLNDELIATGIEVFKKAKCWECHGTYGRGDGEKGWQPDFKDDWGDKIWPTNLTHPWELRNGATLEDLFRSISTGLDGTPMPSFMDAYSDEERWGLAYYLLSLQMERNLASILELDRAEAVPDSPDHELWERAAFIDLKMEGKKVFGVPFISMITNMRVRGVFTASQVGIMLEWIDKKPDKGDDGFPPDAVRIQFPVSRTMVNLWYWSAHDDRAAEFNASGGQMDFLDAQERSNVQSVSSFRDGVHRLIFRRALITGDRRDVRFSFNEHIPFSITAYDGKNREEGTRGAMSAVRYLIMRQPVSP